MKSLYIIYVGLVDSVGMVMCYCGIYIMCWFSWLSCCGHMWLQHIHYLCWFSWLSGCGHVTAAYTLFVLV